MDDGAKKRGLFENENRRAIRRQRQVISKERPFFSICYLQSSKIATFVNRDGGENEEDRSARGLSKDWAQDEADALIGRANRFLAYACCVDWA